VPEWNEVLSVQLHQMGIKHSHFRECIYHQGLMMEKESV